MGMCAKDGLLAISLRPQQPFPSSPIFCRGVSPGAKHAMEQKKEVLDGRCIVPPRHQFHSAVRQRTGSRISRDEESSEEDRPFLPRFWLQEIILAHSPYEGVFHNWPSLQGNLLCRSDSLRLRGIAETECVILPPRCSVCEHLRAGERPSARRSLPAPVLLDEFSWQSDPVPWSRSLALVCAPLLRARVNMVTAKRLAKNPLGAVHNTRNLTNLALVSSQILWLLCPTAVSRLKFQQVQSLHVVASQTVGSRRSGAEPPREDLARAGCSLGVQPGRARRNRRGSRGAPRAGRDGARSLAGAGDPPEHQLSPTQPVVRRSERGQTAPPPQW